ncbi:MAG: DMT family transporter [Lachnospiraceae bacterium]|nr:DMT family transporter [Lachnospiraceae bacterium]
MKAKEIRSSILLVLTAAIWGVAFVAQSEGGDAVGPFSFNFVRFLIGSLVLVPVIKGLDRAGLSVRRPETKEEKRNLWCHGILVGVALFLAANAQQFAISLGAQVSKAGFLTALYILMVPILGLFIKKKCGLNIWVGVLISIVGLYFLCMTDGAGFKAMDLFLLASAVLFAVQILMIDKFAPLTDPVRLSSIQFLVCGLLSAIPAFLFDVPRSGGFTALLEAFASWNAWIPILYAGVLSSGVAYTLQVVAQPGLNPTVASLIMSFEAVFAAISGWIILRQTLNAREILGCVLMFIAIVIAQLPFSGTKGGTKDT